MYMQWCTVEPGYKMNLETMKTNLLYQGEKPNEKSWDQQNYLVILIKRVLL